MSEGLRIYNLFPTLAGPVRDWAEHLPRIAGMGFNAVYINPFHYPGFSGSIYAVKDYYHLNPRFRGQEPGEDDDALLRSPTAAPHPGFVPPRGQGLFCPPPPHRSCRYPASDRMGRSRRTRLPPPATERDP